MKQFFGKKKLAKLVTLSVMTGAMLGFASGAWAEAKPIVIAADGTVTYGGGDASTYSGGKYYAVTKSGDFGDTILSIKTVGDVVAQGGQITNTGVRVIDVASDTTITSITGGIDVKNNGWIGAINMQGSSKTDGETNVSITGVGDIKVVSTGSGYGAKGIGVYSAKNTDISKNQFVVGAKSLYVESEGNSAYGIQGSLAGRTTTIDIEGAVVVKGVGASGCAYGTYLAAATPVGKATINFGSLEASSEQKYAYGFHDAGSSKTTVKLNGDMTVTGATNGIGFRLAGAADWTLKGKDNKDIDITVSSVSDESDGADIGGNGSTAKLDLDVRNFSVTSTNGEADGFYLRNAGTGLSGSIDNLTVTGGTNAYAIYNLGGSVNLNVGTIKAESTGSGSAYAVYAKGTGTNVSISGKGVDKKINATGDIYVGAGAELKINGDASGVGDMTLAGKLNLQNGETAAFNDKLAMTGTFTANDGAKIAFDAKIGAAEAVTSDSISVGTATGTLAMDTANIIVENDTSAVGSKKVISLFTGTDLSGLTITGDAIATSDVYKYDFKQDTTNRGNLVATKGYGGDLPEIIQSKNGLGTISTYILVDDYTATKDLGTLTRPVAGTAREFTINGNGNELKGNGYKGITVASGDTLNLINLANVTGFKGTSYDTAIYNHDGGIVKIKNVTSFAYNTGKGGGAIRNSNGSVTIEGGVTFDHNGLVNNGEPFGGAIFNDQPNSTFVIDAKGEDVKFTNNGNYAENPIKDTTRAGAILNRNGAQMEIKNAENVIFEGNIASAVGGAIENKSDKSGVKASEFNIFAKNIEFVGNAVNGTGALDGGAVYVNQSNMKLVADTVLFKNNVNKVAAENIEGQHGGGAIYVRSASKYDMNISVGKEDGSVTFESNKTTGVGGAIGIRSTNGKKFEMTFDGTVIFDSNTAGDCGGAILNKVENAVSSIVFEDAVTFTNNKAGVDLEGQAIAGSAAKGGAIDNYGTIEFKKGVIFTDNSATGAGGAIYNEAGGVITFNGSTFSGNTAAGVANDIYNAGTLTFKGENTFGGGIEVAGASAQITVEGSVLLEKDAKLTFDNAVTADSLTVAAKANLTADMGNFVTLTTGATYKENTYAVVDVAKKAVNVATGGILGMRYADFTYYTADQCKYIYDSYKGDADYILNLINGELKLETGEQLVIKADNDSQTATIQSTTPVVVDDKNNDTKVNISSVPETYVQVVQNDTGNKPELQSASTLNIANSTFAAKGLQVKDIGDANEAVVNVQTGSTIVLVGDNEAGGSLVKDADNQPVRTKIVVEKDAVLNVGMKENTQEQKGTIADIEVNGDHTLDGNGAKTTEYAYGNMEIQKNASQEGHATVQILNAAGTVEKLTTKENSTLYLDPSYMNVYSLVDNTVSGNIYVGNGSVLEIGHLEGLQAAVKDAGFTVNEASTGFTVGSNETVLALGGSYKVAGGAKLIVDSAVNASGEDANNTGNADVFFGPRSLLVVNGNNHKAVGNVALTLDGGAKINVADTSKLYVQNAKLGETYYIVKDEVATDDIWWLDDNLKGNEFITLTGLYDASDKTYKITTSKGDDTYKFEDTTIPGVATAMNSDTGSKAQDYLTPMLDNATWNGAEGHAAMVKDVNSYANLGENLGVSRGAYDVANMVGNAVTEHWANNAKGENIWAVYTHSKNKVDGMELGGMDAQYDAQYNGVVVGADLSKGFGIALNYTDGNVSNGFGGHNDAKYYGGSIYGRKVFGNWNLFGDLTYTHGKNELAQGGIEADAKTNTISAGLTAKYLNKAGKYATIAPFAGVRYMHIDGKDYTDTLGVNREADKINSVVVPVGLEYTGEFKMAKSAWTFKPVLAVGYLFNLGDRENDMTMRYGGAQDVFGYDFVDSGAFFTHAGMDFENKNFTLGLSYDFMKSKNSKNNKWNVNANVAF